MPLLAMDAQPGNGMREAVSLFYERGVNGQPGPVISTLQQFQAAKESLDQMIQASMKAGEPTNLTRRLTQLRNSVDTAVKRTNPEYRTADRLFSGAKNGQELMQMGANATLRGGNPQRALLQRFAQMTPEQQEFVREGVAQKLKDNIVNLTPGSGSTAKQFDRTALYRFISRVFPPDQSRRLISEIKRETTSTGSLSDVFGNSRTAPMNEGMKRVAEDAAIAGDAMTLNAPAVAKGIGAKISRNFVAEKNNALMRSLMSTDPQTAASATQTVQRGAQSSANSARRSANIVSGLTAAGARGAMQTYPQDYKPSVTRPAAAYPTPAAPVAPPLPQGVPAGAMYSPSRKMWKAPNGGLFHEDGRSIVNVPQSQ
jgi:hypothetical protein